VRSNAAPSAPVASGARMSASQNEPVAMATLQPT
jgi:hypothetical protein